MFISVKSSNKILLSFAFSVLDFHKNTNFKFHKVGLV